VGVKVREIKRKLDGREMAFDCDLIYRDDDAMVIRYESKGNFARIATMSEGYYWQGRNYLIYKMFRDGELVGHRFDVCRDVTFGPDCVEWTDLDLDFFLTPEGELQVHDEDEVAEAIAVGLLNSDDQQIIKRTRQLLTDEHQRIVSEAAAMRARAGG